MKTYTVAILGATGAVGQEMIKVLQERNFPVGKLIPLASERSAGKTLKFRGEDVTIELACEDAPADDGFIDYTKEELILISGSKYNLKFKILEDLSRVFSKNS